MKKFLTLILLAASMALSQDAVLVHGWLGDGKIWEWDNSEERRNIRTISLQSGNGQVKYSRINKLPLMK